MNSLSIRPATLRLTSLESGISPLVNERNQTHNRRRTRFLKCQLGRDRNHKIEEESATRNRNQRGRLPLWFFVLLFFFNRDEVAWFEARLGSKSLDWVSKLTSPVESDGKKTKKKQKFQMESVAAVGGRRQKNVSLQRRNVVGSDGWWSIWRVKRVPSFNVWTFHFAPPSPKV